MKKVTRSSANKREYGRNYYRILRDNGFNINMIRLIVITHGKANTAGTKKGFSQLLVKEF
ncbi:hypothetical protein BpHYR1_015225 [Brachionus plicatilis]|uniref:Uncharacterized protein n=1 Tax=Brachionus plicatilis TaxID=10195 RepID=A0A3M7PBV6_BRAPC|nr:hypothetical protein BpHYR1_015225 [Brachionus plicatilis]